MNKIGKIFGAFIVFRQREVKSLQVKIFMEKLVDKSVKPLNTKILNNSKIKYKVNTK